MSAQNEIEKHVTVMRNRELFEKGTMLLEGKGIPSNIPKAVKCFCEAANDGNVRSIIKVIDLDETGDAEMRSAIMQYADDTLKKRLEYFRGQKNTTGGNVK